MKGRLIDTSEGLFVVSKGKIYRFSDGSFREIPVIANDGTVSNIIIIDDPDPKDGSN